MSDSESSEEEMYDVPWGESYSHPIFDYADFVIFPPQIAAVLENNIERLKKLLQAGKSVNITDNKGNTPLHISILTNKPTIFEFLLTVEDIRIDAVNYEGNSPLIMAIQSDNEYFVTQLIEKGADVNTEQYSQWIPLHHANTLKIAQILIDKGADINAVNFYGETPLHIACEKNDSDLIDMLLYYGADATQPNKNGIAPFHLSLLECSPYIQQILCDYTYDNCKTPVYLHTLIVAMLKKSPLFRKIIDSASELYYNEEDLNYLCEKLPQISPDYFFIFFERFEDVAMEMFSINDTLSHYFRYAVETLEDQSHSSDFLLALCGSSAISVAVDNYHPPKGFSLIGAFVIRTTEKTLTELICCLLSYGLNIASTDLNRLYGAYGYNDLFKILLHMDIIDDKPYDYQNYLMPILIYDMSLDIYKCLKDFQVYICAENVNKLFRYFAIPKLKRLVHREFNTDTDDIIEKMKVLPQVPLLLELSRNKARKYIIKRYKVKKSVEFYTILKWLPISQIYKDILSYERQLYKV